MVFISCMKINKKGNISKLNVDGKLILYVILQIKMCRKDMQYGPGSNIAF